MIKCHEPLSDRIIRTLQGIENLGDPLSGIGDRIDFERNRNILADLYDNDTEKGGRPKYDPVLMVRILLLEQW